MENIGCGPKMALDRTLGTGNHRSRRGAFLGRFQVDYRISRVRGMFLLLSLRAVDTHAELVGSSLHEQREIE